MWKLKKVRTCFFLLSLKCLHFYNTFGLVFCLSSGAVLKGRFSSWQKEREKKKHGTLCTNTVLVARVCASALRKQSGSCFRVLSVRFIYFIFDVSEVSNLSADALCRSPTPHFQSVCFCCRFIIGCTGLTCLEQAGCLSQRLDEQ